MKAPYILLPFLVACGAQDPAINAEPSTLKGEQTAKTVVTDNGETKPQQNKGGQTKAPRFLQQGKQEHVFDINDTKLRADASELRPGTQVFDVSVGAFATVSNFLVIISTDAETRWQQDFEVSKLARDTFKLIPKSEQLSMDAWYKRLKAEKGIVRVELGINYSPKSKAADR